LNPTANQWLQNARAEALRMGLRSSDIVQVAPDKLYWFTWTGTRAQRTLLLAARRAGLEMEDEKIAVQARCTAASLRQFAADFVAHPPTTEELAALVPWKQMRKFDRFLSDELLTVGLARNCLDLPEALRTATMLIERTTSSGR